jgi:hypothetical protein
MNAHEFNSGQPLEPINECRRAECEQAPGHSKGKPDVPTMTTKIDVRFATPLPVAVEIRRRGALLERNPGPVRVPLYLVAQWRRFSEEP